MRNHVLSEDLRYEYAYQQIYLRSVELTGLRVPDCCPVEAMAFGMISCSQVGATPLASCKASGRQQGTVGRGPAPVLV